MLVLLAMTGVGLAADCDAPTTPPQVDAHVQEALLAFATLDEDGVHAAVQQADETVACLVIPLPATGSASVHRIHGLEAFMGGDADAAKADFHAAALLDPATGLSNKVAPSGGKLARLYEEAKEMPEPSAERFSVPSGLTTYVDGAKASTRPDGLPVVLQVEDAKSKVVYSAWVGPTDAVTIPVGLGPVAQSSDVDGGGTQDLDGEESLLAAHKKDKQKAKATPDDDGDELGASASSEEEDEDVPEDLDGPVKSHGGGGGGGGGGHSGVMWGAAAGSGVVAAALFGTSAYMRTQFDQDPTHGKFVTTNGTWAGSIGMTAVALGFAGVAISGSF